MFTVLAVLHAQEPRVYPFHFVIMRNVLIYVISNVLYVKKLNLWKITLFTLKGYSLLKQVEKMTKMMMGKEKENHITVFKDPKTNPVVQKALAKEAPIKEKAAIKTRQKILQIREDQKAMTVLIDPKVHRAKKTRIESIIDHQKVNFNRRLN